MKAKTLVLKETADAEAQAAVDYYEQVAGPTAAFGFVAAYETTLRWIGAYPPAGSPRYAEATRTPGLRSRALDGFPYVVLYRESEDAVEVLHVLHQHRDIPAVLRTDEA